MVHKYACNANAAYFLAVDHAGGQVSARRNDQTVSAAEKQPARDR